MKNIKLIDIQKYLHINLKFILASAFLGLIASFAYCVMTPKLYEASFILRLARIDPVPGYTFSNENLGREIPFILDAQRAFGNPAYPNQKLLIACGLNATNDSIKRLIAETSIMRGPDNKELFVRIRVPGYGNAASCAKAIIENSLRSYEERKAQVLEEVLAENPGSKVQNFKILDPALNGVISISDSYVYPNFGRIIIGSIIFSVLGCLYLVWLCKKIARLLRDQG